MTNAGSWLHRRASPLGVGLALLVAAGVLAAVLTFRHVETPKMERVDSIAGLQRVFADLDYSLAAVRDGGRVPRLTISDVPDRWDDDLDASVRKRVFFEAVLPLVLIVNERVRQDRQRLREIDAHLRDGRSLGTADQRRLAALAGRYGIEIPPAVDHSDAMRKALATLLRRVGPVPPSLALAQSAVESAYGTSRFAAAGNALFGQWTTGTGIRPEDQADVHAGFKVATFGSPLRSVEAYVHNLNTHRAYRDFRREREQYENRNAPLSGPALARALSAYSEKGVTYTDTLRTIIRINRLDALDAAALADGRRIRVLVP
jgi:Bax protein